MQNAYRLTDRILRLESPRFIGQHLAEARIMVRYPQGMSESGFESWAWNLAAYAEATLKRRKGA